MKPSVGGSVAKAEPSSSLAPPAPSTRWLPELIALLALGLGVLAVVRAWPDLPARVPTHFGLSGQPDGWGGRGTILLLPVISVVLYIVLSAVQRIPASWYNYPVAITGENRERQVRLARSLVSWLKAGLAAMLAHLTIATLRTALGSAEGLDPFVIWVWLAVIFALVGIYLARAIRAR